MNDNDAIFVVALAGMGLVPALAIGYCSLVNHPHLTMAKLVFIGMAMIFIFVNMVLAVAASADIEDVEERRISQRTTLIQYAYVLMCMCAIALLPRRKYSPPVVLSTLALSESAANTHF